LGRCIESLVNQTIEDIEIILVNDGSTDDSLSACEAYAAQDERIILIDKKNQGVSEARNDGLRAATGTYVGFVDPDDWVDTDMYESMVTTAIGTDAAICMCNYVKENKDNIEPVLLKQSGVIEGERILTEIVANVIAKPSFRSGETDIMGSVCRLLIRRDFLVKEDIWFDKGVAFMEDLLVCIEAFLKCERIVIDNGAYYHYRVHDNSAVNAYKANFYEKQKNAFEKLQTLLVKERQAEALAPRMANRYIIIALLSLANEVHKDNPQSLRRKLANIDQICRDERLTVILKKSDLSDFEPRKQVELKMIKRNAKARLYLYYKTFNKIKSMLGKG